MIMQTAALKERIAAYKWLGPNTNSGQMYDVLMLMDALFHCRDVKVIDRALRVCRHVLSPIQRELQEENESKYYDEAYGVQKEESGKAI